MQLRRPIAALFTALALLGGGATMTGCEAAGQDQNDGTTDDSGNTGGSEPSGDTGNLPDNTNEDPDDTDTEEDPQ
jgi:hypothetical protein